jgi:hypothetical protein
MLMLAQHKCATFPIPLLGIVHIVRAPVLWTNSGGLNIEKDYAG